MISSLVIASSLYHEEEGVRRQESGVRMLRCCITDRTLDFTGQVDWVQVRDKELPARELIAVVRLAMARVGKVLVNSRVDVALAAGAAGVHLPSGSIAASEWRRITPAGFLIGVSCHSLEDVVLAEREGADYVVFGPVFDPLSKTSDLPAQGLEELGRVSRSVRIPVLALGGITWENASDCVAAGAAGIAGITMFRS
jgi:thiamine-phosphate pyrophosphorylase